tara:strand:+ start:7737 stop:7862 length:126 start_codon:yes stop_codon:yes gene_type:complete
MEKKEILKKEPRKKSIWENSTGKLRNKKLTRIKLVCYFSNH